MRAVRHFLLSLRFGKGSAAVKLCTGNVATAGETAVPAGLRLILNLNQLIDVGLSHEPPNRTSSGENKARKMSVTARVYRGQSRFQQSLVCCSRNFLPFVKLQNFLSVLLIFAMGFYLFLKSSCDTIFSFIL